MPPYDAGTSGSNALEDPSSKGATSDAAHPAISAPLDVEAAFQQVGPFGRAQVCAVLMSSMCWAAAAWGFSLPIFIAASPHRKVVSCTGAALADASSCEVGALLGEDAGCEDHSEDSYLVWAYDHPEETLAAEWELVCQRHVLVALVGSVYFFGVLAGNMLLGPVPDMIGRTRALCLSIFICAPSSAIGAIAPSFTVYLVSRFVHGFGAASVCAVAWVAACESVGSSYKPRVIMAMSMSWAFGMLALVPVVLVVPEWRPLTWIHTMVWLCLLIVSLAAWKRGLESPSWFASRGDLVGFHRVMAEIARVNRATYVAQGLVDYAGVCGESQLDQGKMNENSASGCSLEEKEAPADVNFKAVFFKAPWGRYTVVFSLSFSALSLGYYGLSLNSGHTEGDSKAHAVHIALALSALAEVPGNLLAALLMGSPRFGRRCTLFSGLCGSSICCLGLALVPTDAVKLSTALSSAGKIFNCIGYLTIFVYAAEVYPVLVRGFTLGVFSTASRITAIMAPVLVELPPPLPALLIGAGMGVCALPTLLLPETLPKAAGATCTGAEKAARAPGSGSASVGAAAKFRGVRRYAHLAEEGGDARESTAVRHGMATASQEALPEPLGRQT